MNIKSLVAITMLALCVYTEGAESGSDEIALKSDGFIRDWVVLAPIQLESDANGGEAIEKSQIPDEGMLKPKAGERVTVAGKGLTWKKHKSNDYYVDLNGMLGQQTEKTVGYAVAYVHADAERKNLDLKMGSNDQGKVYVNGKLLLKATEPRSMDQDADIAKVSLNKGLNVVVFKIFNEGGSDWQGCLRFTEQNGKPVTNLTVRLSP